MTSELELLMKDFSEERKKEIYDKADRLEVYFNTAGIVMMKDKDEQWVEGMLSEGESFSDFTKLDKLVDCWHEDESIEVPLHEYLGMSWDDYSVWATNPSKYFTDKCSKLDKEGWDGNLPNDDARIGEGVGL